MVYLGITGGETIKRVSHCYNTGDLTTTGSNTIVGIAKMPIEITYCYNTGKIVCTANFSGGIAGICRDAKSISYCYNTGDVEGYKNVAGIIAYAENRVENCYNTGNIKASNYTVGGITAWVPQTSDGRETSIKNCYNTGEIWTAGSNCGGIIGGVHLEKNNVVHILNCYNIGTVSCGGRKPGGIYGGGSGVTNEFIEKHDLNNNYYLDTSSTGGIYGNDYEGKAEAKDDEFFKQDKNVQTSITYLLNAGNGENSNVWERKDDVNDGYPYLRGIKPKE